MSQCLAQGDKRPFDKTLASADSSALRMSLDCIQEEGEQEAAVSEPPSTPLVLSDAVAVVAVVAVV